MKHIMIDIETMGNGSNTAIVSIGAVKFDLNTGETGDTFYKIVDLQSCLDIGLNVKGSTIMWWLSQSEESRKELYENKGKSIDVVLEDFSKFCTTEYEVWGNSPRFDLGILHDAYRKLNLDISWNFRKERDVRTLVSFAPDIKENYKFEGVLHNALNDCYNQIGYCVEIWNKLNK